MAETKDRMSTFAGKLPQVGESDSVNEVVHEMAQRQVGSFIYKSEGRGPLVIAGRALAETLLERSTSGQRGVTVGEMISEGVLERTAAFAVNDGPGVLLNIKPPRFICANPTKSHTNREWNNGRCKICPFPITAVE